MLQIGKQAPDFSLKNQVGESISLNDYKGKQWVILYFYPKDDTEGCTLEAQGFSTLKKDYDALHATVIGVSKDTTQSHQKFCAKFGLQVTLLSDNDGQVIERYEAWGPKKMFGRDYMGILRSTYLIDPEGVIRAAWPNVSPKGHEIEVFTTLKKLQI